MVSSQLQHNYRLFHCKQEAIRTVPRREILQSNNIGSDHYLTLAKLRFTPKWLHLPKNTASKETSLQN
jgi:hypothetical protein